MKIKIRLFASLLGAIVSSVIIFVLLKNVSLPFYINAAVIFVGAFVGFIAPRVELDDITSEKAGNSQHGSARWATKEEEFEQFSVVNKNNTKQPGIIVGVKHKKYEVDTSDQNISLIAPPGSGKTKRMIIPTIRYNALVNIKTKGKGASMVLTDLKGELRDTAKYMIEKIVYLTPALDFANPLLSPKFNLLYNVNKYMDKYKQAETEEEKLMSYGKAERYAKILAESIISNMNTTSASEASEYFNETSRGLITGIALLVSEYGDENQRHIISVFKLIIELNGLQEGSSDTLQKSKLEDLLQYVDNERIVNYVGPALKADVRTSMNIFSSALGKLVKFIDAELEQMICSHDESLNDMDFIKNPTAIFIICPDENPTRHFFASLFIRYLMNDLIEQSRDTGGVLPRKVICLWDEFGNMPPIQDIDVLFSAARSRGIRFLIALQSYAQLEKHYSKQMAEIILDSTQITIFTYVSPNARETAERFSKMLDNQTIKTGSVSYGQMGNVSYQLMQKPLLYPGDIMTMKAGNFVVVKAGKHPVKTVLPFWWEYISKKVFEPYISENKAQIVIISYLTAQQLMDMSRKKSCGMKVGMFD
ncbi:MAG: type IV secretory system conjugative DNA transfer family protein [Oscillospiraceae bacterium]